MRLGYVGEDLDIVLAEYSRLKDVHLYKDNWGVMSDEELWIELCLCMLSSNVPFELARSALDHLRTNRCLDVDHILKSEHPIEMIAHELGKSVFLPVKKDGTRRKYRFPKPRANDIVCAARHLYDHGNGVLSILKSAESEESLRFQLVELVPGIGMKQASHFLRNVGYSKCLAIVDTHIIEFLKRVLGVPIEKRRSVNQSQYLAIESLLVELCGLLGVDLPLFDLAIWQYMRGG